MGYDLIYPNLYSIYLRGTITSWHLSVRPKIEVTTRGRHYLSRVLVQRRLGAPDRVLLLDEATTPIIPAISIVFFTFLPYITPI